MTESEDTSATTSAASGGASAPARKRAGQRRRKKATASRGKTTAAGRKAASRRTTSGTRKGAATRRRRPARATGLEAFLNDLAKRANRAGSRLSDLSEEGSAAARRTLVKVTASSKQTISRVKREWDRLDNTRKIEFVAGLLAALGAATAVRKAAARK